MQYIYYTAYSPQLISQTACLIPSPVSRASYRDGGEGQADASEAIQRKSQKDERWEDCRESERNIKTHFDKLEDFILQEVSLS